MKVTRYVCLAVCLVAGTRAFSQLPIQSNRSEFRGRITDGSTSSYNGLVVEVTNLVDRTIRDHADVSTDGLFGFRSLPDGDYQVRVMTQYGEELDSTVASVGQFGLPFEIRLPQAKLQKPAAGTVSIQQLNHPPSKQAMKLLSTGERLMKDGHYVDAATRFREAAGDAPDCAQAHADLGLALSKMLVWDGAEKEYRAAVSLEPRNSLLHSNLSVALASLKRFDEAEHEALTALKLDPRNARAHFVVAGALIRRNGQPREIMAHLLAAEDSFPPAKKAVEQICADHRVEGCPQ